VRYAARTMPAAPRMNVLLLVYLVAGAIVAATHKYYAHLHTARQYGSAALAVVLWPLLLLGINFHIHLKPGRCARRARSVSTSRREAGVDQGLLPSLWGDASRPGRVSAVLCGG
jgi:hypothetical protein